MKEYNLKPLARLVAFSTVGVQPEIMGIGPVPAIENVLKVAGEKLENIDLIEVSGYSLTSGSRILTSVHSKIYYMASFYSRFGSTTSRSMRRLACRPWLVRRP